MTKGSSPNYLLIIFLFIGIVACKTESQKDVSVAEEIAPYHEKHRPQFHFSPQEDWMNDPNGMVYHQGEYHLFYQYYPDSTVWGPMHWGHAVSTDLIHWTHLPIALYPDSLGYIFSGGAVIDENNTSGFGTPSSPPMVAFFTYHNPQIAEAKGIDVESQALAYSLDNGRSWTKYAGNPVIKNPGIRDFRDPNVIWHEQSQKWILALAASDRLFIYNSPNLKDWEKVSEFGANSGNHDGVWECPDLFPLQIGDKEKWVLLQNINPGHPHGGSGTQYFIGDFDGKVFKNDNPEDVTLWLDYGKDNYAGVTWANAPDKPGQRTFIGWMSNWQYAQQVPTYPWRSAMTLPRLLQLVESEKGYRLASIPIPTVTKIRKEAVAFSKGVHKEDLSLMDNVKNRNGLYEVQIEFEKPKTGELKIEVYNSIGDVLFVGYNADQNEYFVDRLTAGDSEFSTEFAGRHVAPCFYSPETIKMHLFFDVASVELFADDGKTTMTEIFFPNEPYTDITVNASEEDPVTMIRARIFELGSIW